MNALLNSAPILLSSISRKALSSSAGLALKKFNKTLSIAESCTGGCLSSLITDVSGSSEYFKGGIVAYHNDVKISQLRISQVLLKKQGAVSAPVAKKMAQNVRNILKTDIGIGLTGIAGPSGGSAKKPVGLVYIALDSGRKRICKKYHFFGSRAEIKLKTASQALKLLLRLL